MPPKNVSVRRSQFNAGAISAAANSNISATSVEETTRRFNLLKDQVPELGGTTLWQLAGSSTPDAMLLNSAVRALDLGAVKEGVESLKGESLNTQKVRWANMSPAKQQIYLDNGYKVPKESSPWWKSALGTAFTPVKAVGAGIGWAWDKSGADSTIGRAASAVGSGISGAFNALTWVSDQAINRPFRAMVDISGQNQEARLDLTFEQARENLENRGVNLTNAEWEYLKWKYVEVNGFQRTYYGREGENPAGSMIARGMAAGNPGGGTMLQVFDAITSINQVGDIVKDIPLVGRLVKDAKTENQYDGVNRASGATVQDDIFQKFADEVAKLEENEEYNLSPWSSWNRATNGNNFINPVKQVESIDKLRAAGLDSQSFDYAMYRAKGRSAEEWITDVEGVTADNPQFVTRRQFLSQYESNKDFKDVVGELKASGSRYSIGRGYAEAFGLPEDSALYTAVSGAADAAVLMTLDPTIFLGKANKIWRVVRKGVQLADIPRVRFFAKALAEGTNVVDTPIIEGVENIGRVNEAVSKISAQVPNLQRVFSRSQLDEIQPLLDESGVVSDFAIDNYDEINALLDDAQKSLINQRANLSDVVEKEFGDDALNAARTVGAPPSVQPGNLDEINETLDAIEVAKQLMMRIPPHDASIKELGRTLSHVRVKQAEKYNRFVETVTEGFKKINAAADDEARYLAGNELRKKIRGGNKLVTLMVEYNDEVVNRGFAGMDSYDTVWDFIESNKTLWGSGVGTSQAIRGFGNGMKVQDTWRLFSNGAESALLDRNAYTMLPELSKPGVFLRKVGAKSEIVMDEIKRLKNINAIPNVEVSQVTDFAVRLGSKPIRMASSLLWNLTHHVPKTNGFMSLSGPDAVAEFEKLLNYGVFAGLSRKDRDIFMGKFILGLGEDVTERWIYNGSLAEGQQAFKFWDELIGVRGDADLTYQILNYQGLITDPNKKVFSGALSIPIFNSDGTLTKYGVENFDGLKAVVWDYFKDDLDNPALDIWKKQYKAEARSATLASRFMVERLFLEDLFRRTGMDATPAGKEVVDRFLNQLTTARYGPNDIDVVGLGESAQRVALLPTVQYDELAAFPDFTKDIQKHATQLGLLSRSLRRTFNSNFVETIMGTYWKPATLLRLGFIPRAAGEEFLAFYARAGIWAPLSFMTTQAAADRRGLVGALTALPGRISAKKFGELGRAGLDGEMWKLSAMVPYANVSDYIASVAGEVAQRTGKDLNRFDYLALHSAFWTGSVAKNIKQVQFRLLPEIMQTGIIRSMTEKNENWVQNGLVTLDGLSNAVYDAAKAATRDPLHQQAIAAAHIESGRTVVPNPADDKKPTLEFTVQDNRYGMGQEKVTVEFSHQFEQIDNMDHATATEISYTYSLAGEEQVLQPVFEEMAGTVTPSTLDGAIAPMLRGTQWEVPVTVIEPEYVPDTIVPDELLSSIDIADPSNLDIASPPGSPDLLDRYVEVLRARADSLDRNVVVAVDDEVGGQTVLSTASREFTTESPVTIDQLNGINAEDIADAMRPADEVVEEGAELPAEALEQFSIQYEELVSQLSDKDLLELQANNLLQAEIDEVNVRAIDSVEDSRRSIVDREWQRRQKSKQFEPEQIQRYLDELVVDEKLSGEWPYDLTEALTPPETLIKRPYNIPAENITRASVVADLRRIAGRQANPQRSIWFNDAVLGSSDEADALRGLAEYVFQTERLEPSVAVSRAARTQYRTEDIVEAANRFRSYVLDLKNKDRKLLYQWLQGVDRVPNSSGVLPDLASLGLNPDDPLLTPAIKSLMSNSTTNSVIDQLVISGMRQAAKGDTRLMTVLDVLTRTQSTRYRQLLASTSPIKVGSKAELLAAIKPILVAQLKNPDFAKQVRGNRRYLVNSNTAKKLAVPTGDNAHQIYFVMVDSEFSAEIVESLSKLNDNELFSFVAAAAGDEGLSPEVYESIKQLLVNFDTDASRGAGFVQEALSEGSIIPLNSIGFMDYDHAQQVKKALQNIEYNRLLDPERGTPTFRLGATATKKDAKNIVRMPNSPYAHRALDEGLVSDARVIQEEDITRFDDNGFVDEFGNTVIEGETIDNNLDAWADKLTLFIDQTFFSQQDEVLEEVLQPIRRRTFGVEAVTTVPTSQLPSTMFRPKKYVPPKENVFQRLTRRGFGEVINPAIFALVRHPMYLLAFSNGYEFARANNAIFRNAGLDRFVESWAKRSSVDLDELRNLWSMIPEDRAQAIYGVQDFVTEIEFLFGAGKIDPNSPILRQTKALGLGKLTKKETEDLGSVIDWARMDRNVENINVSIAMDRAVNEMIPYIDDHQVRSFFQEYARNIMPFQFAQEQFLKRWARTVTYSPESFRRIQLLAHAFTNNGFVEEQNGQKYFVIPGTESLNELLGKVPVFKNLFGGNVNMPVSIPMGLNTRNVLPGIPSDLENLPAFSPFAMIGIEQLANHFPEIKKAAQEFNGGRPIETNQSFTDTLLDFVPRNYQRMYTGLIGGFSNSPKGMEAELSRNAIAAIQQAEAEAARLRIEQQQLIALGKVEEAADMQERINQLAPPPNASAEQVSKYLDTIKDWTRANMFVRGALGFVTPTTTTNLFEGEELAAEFGILLGQMSFDEALAVFLSENPSGAAYTVFKTAKSSKAPLPRTDQAINWMQKNDGFMRSFAMAAPWLVPQSDSTDDFSQQAYTDMLGAGIRYNKDVDTWYGDFKFAAGANIYFPTKLKYDIAKSENGNPAVRSRLEAQWQAEAQIIKLQNPVFAERLAKMVSTDADKTMAEMKAIFALSDSELPEVAHIEGLRAAVEAWDLYSARYASIAGKNSKQARAVRNNLQTGFINYGNELLMQFPELRSFWNSIVLPALDLTSKQAIIEIGGR